MKKKLYYTVSPELENIDGIYETNGNQIITCYSIVNNVPVKQFDIECQIDGDDEEKIDEYLIDNGMGEDEFEFIIL